MQPAQPKRHVQGPRVAQPDRAIELCAQRRTDRVRRLLLDIEAETVGAPFVERRLVHAHYLQSRKWRDRRRSRRIDRHLIADLGLAQELVGPRRAVGRAGLQAGDRDLPLELIVGIGVAGQQVGVKADHGERAVGRNADRIGPALAQEGVCPQRAAGVARTDAQQQARQHPIVDARRRAAEVVDERLAVAIALHRAEAAETARPYAERACAVADRHVARLGQGLTLPAAGTAACHSHLLTDRIHEQRVGSEVRRSESA